MVSLDTPDVTKIQQLAAAGLDLSKDLQDSIIQLVTVLSAFLFAGDAVIRHGRSRALQNPPKGEVASDDGNPSA